MKFIARAALMLSLVFVMTGAYATKSATVKCASFSSCYQIKQDLLPTGQLQDYPQYARSGIPRFRGDRSVFSKRRHATGRRVFIFSPRHKAWAAYMPNGELIGQGRASGGANWCKDIGRSCRTIRGTFRVYTKGSVYCRSSKYPRPRGGAPMPYCMYFRGGYGIHGSPNVPNYNASHGCIRVKKNAAAWLHRYFIRIGTTVIVTSY